MSDAASDDEFEILARRAGIPDIPVVCEAMAAHDVMRPTDARAIAAHDATDPVPMAMVCGYWNALAQLGDVWRQVVVLALAETPELAAAFEPGPGPVFETMWWINQLVDDGPAVVFCSVVTSDLHVATPRRFSLMIPPMPEFVADLSVADVFALCLVDGEDESDVGDDEQGLLWFVENDRDLWATLVTETL